MPVVQDNLDSGSARGRGRRVCGAILSSDQNQAGIGSAKGVGFLHGSFAAPGGNAQFTGNQGNAETDVYAVRQPRGCSDFQDPAQGPRCRQASC